MKLSKKDKQLIGSFSEAISQTFETVVKKSNRTRRQEEYKARLQSVIKNASENSNTPIDAFAAVFKEYLEIDYDRQKEPSPAGKLLKYKHVVGFNFPKVILFTGNTILDEYTFDDELLKKMKRQ